MIDESIMDKIRQRILEEAQNYAEQCTVPSVVPSEEYRLRKELNSILFKNQQKANRLRTFRNMHSELLSVFQRPESPEKPLLEKLELQIRHYSSKTRRQKEEQFKLKYLKDREKGFANKLESKINEVSGFYARYGSLATEAKITESTIGLAAMHKQYQAIQSEKYLQKAETHRERNLSSLKQIDRKIKERITRGTNQLARSIYKTAEEHSRHESLMKSFKEVVHVRSFQQQNFNFLERTLHDLKNSLVSLQSTMKIDTDISDPLFVSKVCEIWEQMKHSEYRLQFHYESLSKHSQKLSNDLDKFRTQLDLTNASVHIFNKFQEIKQKIEKLGRGKTTNNLLVDLELLPLRSVEDIEKKESLIVHMYSFIQDSAKTLVKCLRLIKMNSLGRSEELEDILVQFSSLKSEDPNMKRQTTTLKRRAVVQKQRTYVYRKIDTSSKVDASSPMPTVDLSSSKSIFGIKLCELFLKNAYLMTFNKKTYIKKTLEKAAPLDEDSLFPAFQEILENSTKQANIQIMSGLNKLLQILNAVNALACENDNDDNKRRIKFKENDRLSWNKISGLVKQVFDAKYRMVIKTKKIRNHEVNESRFLVVPFVFDQISTDNLPSDSKGKSRQARNSERLPPLISSQDFANEFKRVRKHISSLSCSKNRIIESRHKMR